MESHREAGLKTFNELGLVGREEIGLKVSIFTGSRITYFGGGERYAIDLGNELVRRGFKVIVFTQWDDSNSNLPLSEIEKMCNFEIVRYNILPFIRSPTVPVLNKMLFSKLKDTNIVYNMDDSLFTTFLLILFSRLNHIRYISGMHIPRSFMFGFEASTHPNLKSIWRIYKYFLRALYKGFIDNVHILNKEQMKDLDSLKYSGKTYFIPNYINDKREKVEVNKNDFVVLFTANINIKIKGVDLLCDIIERTLLEGKDIKFEITGQSGDGVDLVDRLVKKYPNNVFYLGFISDKELKDLLRTASLFILTSRFESFSLSVLRAQAFGLPVVAFNITGPNEIIIRDITGKLIEPYDTAKFSEAILTYYHIWRKDVLLYSKIKEDIQNFAYEKFGKEKTIKELISMLTGETLTQD